MKEIEIKPVGAEPLQAALAGGHRAAAGGIVRVDLADQEDLVAAAGDDLADHFLGAALAIHLGGIDQRHAEGEPEPRYLLIAARQAQVPQASFSPNVAQTNDLEQFNPAASRRQRKTPSAG